jgi:phage/plasmid-like protein (TIGR03299 family)
LWSVLIPFFWPRRPEYDGKLLTFLGPPLPNRYTIYELFTIFPKISLKIVLTMSVVYEILILQENNPQKERQHMAHELETVNGETAFASLREPAWHGLGTVFTEEVSTAEMLKKAKLNDWNVRLEDVEIPTGMESDKNYSFVVRDNPFIKGNKDVLGVVGERYVPLQNEDLFDFADNILHSGGRWETAGSIKGGRIVFGSVALERETVLDPNGVSDKVNTYLLVNTSHDGSISIQASITPVRVVCANTLNLALGNRGRGGSVKQSFKIRHTQTASGKVQAAREALGLANAYMDEFDKMANEMIQKEVSKKKFDEIVLALYPKPKDEAKGANSRWENKIDLINSIYVGDFNNTISGTAWGVANALTERLDWYRAGRKGKTESILASASGFDPMTNAEKNRIFKAVQLATA